MVWEIGPASGQCHRFFDDARVRLQLNIVSARRHTAQIQLVNGINGEVRHLVFENYSAEDIFDDNATQIDIQALKINEICFAGLIGEDDFVVLVDLSGSCSAFRAGSSVHKRLCTKKCGAGKKQYDCHYKLQHVVGCVWICIMKTGAKLQ